MAGLKDKVAAWRERRDAAKVESAVPGSGPGLAAFAAHNPLSTDLFVRRLATQFRVSVMVIILLAIGNFMQAGAISNLLPLKTTEIALVHTFGPEEQFYRVEPLNQDVDGFLLFLENRIGRWVKLLFELDRTTQEARFQEAVYMTDSGLWRQLQDSFANLKEISNVLNQGMTRTVDVLGVSQVAAQEGGQRLFAVDFVQRDFSKGQEVTAKSLRAYVLVELRPHEVRKADRYLNPFGITVVDMNLREAANNAE